MTYQLIDSGEFMKLEQVGPYRLARPSAQAVWKRSLSEGEWKKADVTFERYSDGKGDWKIHNKSMKKIWDVEIAGLKMQMQMTGFGHIGIFAEQKANWISLMETVAEFKKHGEVKVLNLFAYTGGSTLACAKAGAEVVHLDASKTSIEWAKENAKLSGLSESKIRWMLDDAAGFVKRELRRGNKYNGIILDPPSYGRGAKNQVWKIEDHLVPLLEDLHQLLDPQRKFVLLSCHSPGYTPTSLSNLLFDTMNAKPAQVSSGEMLIESQGQKALPSGAFAFFQS